MKKLVVFVFVSAMLTSCLNVKQIEQSYQLFQTGFDSGFANFTYKPLHLKEGDGITIQVYTVASTNQEQVAIFNLQGANGKIGSYTLNNQGEIDLPKIGRLKVSGFTCDSLRERLKTEWSKYIKDIGVDVQMNGFTVNVLGEVRSPGAKPFKSEKANIIDAISASGGLSDEGKRGDILIVREDSGKRVSYRLDLRDAKLYASPAFQLQQNDMIYVAANDRKFKNIQNTDFQQKVVPITTIASLGFTVVNMVLVIYALRK
jgi:polysaccharide export outer membrane protein